MELEKLNLMKNRKGWVKILEAAVAIMLIFGFMLYLRAKVEKPALADQMYEMTHRVLSEISANETLRNEILNETLVEKPLTNISLNASINKYGFDYSFKVCKIADSCPPTLPAESKDKEIFADTIIMSANPGQIYSPKKLSLFVWMK